MSIRVGVDVGGTFTDLALFDSSSGRLEFGKTPSTPDDPSGGVVSGLEHLLGRCEVSPDAVEYFIHGTTVALNTVLERSGSRTALVTTAGFRDVLQIGRQDRPHLYDWRVRRPAPLSPRRLRFEVPERVLYTGEVLEPLSELAIHDLIGRLREVGVESVAVCLLHSYANPLHESALGRAIEQALPGVSLSLSSEVLPEFKEYDRMSTTVVNAYVRARTAAYLAGLESALVERGVSGGVHVMQSNGGIVSAGEAGRRPVHTILSGPAAGVIGGTAIAGLAGEDNSITIDMGGTSFDVALCSGGEVARTREGEVGGLPVKSPSIDIHTLGAGGGSIAWIDAGGALRVGPRSAGADPGPACYGRGGLEPTVTDANLVLGRLSPDGFLGGGMTIDPALAREAIQRCVAGPLGLSIEEAAAGMVRVINAVMIKGIRVVSVARGYDPRDFVLAAFGGAGPLHAAQLATELHVPRVLVPVAPGVTSALGLLLADMRRDYIRTVLTRAGDEAAGPLGLRFVDMEEEARADMAREGVDWEDVELVRTAEARYAGQGFELDVVAPPGVTGPAEVAEIVARFSRAHEGRYGYSSSGNAVEIVNLRLTAIARLPRPDLHRAKGGTAEAGPPTAVGSRPVYFDNGFADTAIYERDSLGQGAVIGGPAVIEQLDSTTLLWPGDQASVDGYGNLRLEVGSR